MSVRACRRRHSKSNSPSLLNRRLLAIRPGGVGDCILSFPAIESLRARCDYLEVWVPHALVPLVHFADRVRAISSTGLDLMGIPGIDPPAGLMRDFDAIVSWYGGNRDEFRHATAHLPMEFHSALPPAECSVHAVDFFCRQLGTPTKIPRIDVQAAGRDFIAIHPFSGSARKNWPLDQFDAVAHALGNPVEWCATSEQVLADRRPILVEEDLGKVAQWLASARLYIGNDCGITHLAAAVGTPVIALFQASDPCVWAPRGDNVVIVESPTVNSVLAAARSMLSPTKTQSTSTMKIQPPSTP